MARSKNRSGPRGKRWGPEEHLKRLEAHRCPLLRAAWEATRSHLHPATASQLTGFPQPSIRYWVAGTSIPSLERGEQFARALGRSDLVAWLAEGELYRERLRQAARTIEHHRQRRRSHRRRLAEERLRGAGDAIADYFQGLDRAQQQALLRRLKTLAPPQR